MRAGGTWDDGSASYFLYNANADVTLVQDVVIVMVNYRLNVFGFLGSTALRKQVTSPAVYMCALLSGFGCASCTGSRRFHGKLRHPGS